MPYSISHIGFKITFKRSVNKIDIKILVREIIIPSKINIEKIDLGEAPTTLNKEISLFLWFTFV